MQMTKNIDLHAKCDRNDEKYAKYVTVLKYNMPRAMRMMLMLLPPA